MRDDAGVVHQINRLDPPTMNCGRLFFSRANDVEEDPTCLACISHYAYRSER